ncbi:hypothetical protein PVAG01_09009 [Phlyctema vagabunda]|uniref:Uncharacterized protein n=1 Tax=Phlyctema vagabunda TaxID=108571 RepID=A0ABR4P656_9HELO
MQYSSTLLVVAFTITRVLAHGVVTEVQGANGVTMPGLSVVDGTPRDCPTARCGAQSDTAIIRKNELGTTKASALGRTTGSGPIDATKMMAVFMDGAAGNTTAVKEARALHFAAMKKRQLFGGANKAAAGTKTPAGTTETGVQAATGQGASSGLPTTNAAGEIDMTLHQINQDGAGPFKAKIDGTSGGTDVTAFEDAEVTQNVPGIVAGLSAATNMDFKMTVAMPAGMTCNGQVGDATNVCVGMVANSAAAGPFGGAYAFTQSTAARKRAIQYRLRKRNLAKALGRRQTEDEIDVDELEELIALEDGTS